MITIGSYDGVHLAHQDVIRHAVAAADAKQVSSALLTFEPHPRCVLDPGHCPQSITTLKEKLDLIERLGIEHAVVLEFSKELAALSPDDFMNKVGAAFEVAAVTCGHDFSFGSKRAGNAAWLREHGYEVIVVAPFELEGEEVHSSEIRRHVTAGEIERANRLLGREFSLAGLVEPGDRVGRTLGFPTVNVGVEPNKLVPGHGVYAGWVTSPAGKHMGALSVGYRPTFGGTQLRVEAFLLDYEGDLYQQWVEVRFAGRIREHQVKFDTADELARQIAKDVQETRRLLQK